MDPIIVAPSFCAGIFDKLPIKEPMEVRFALVIYIALFI